MLSISELQLEVEGKSILHGISKNFESGKTYALLGHNGSGKSSLALTVAGHPKYSVVSWEILLDGKSIKELSASERAELGVFLAFQNVTEIPGVRLSEFLRTAYNTRLKRVSPETKPLSPFLFKRMLAKESVGLGIPESFFDRDLFVGFSGGEKRRIELLAMKLLSPSVVILDEIDSGLDIDAFETVANFLANYKTPERTIIIISHNFAFLRRIGIDETLVLSSGKVERTWDANVIDELEKTGFLVAE